MAVKHSLKGGFTLVELLVVMAIIGILAGILLPALSRTKAKTRAILCMNNVKQLQFALHAYADDFDSRYPYNTGGQDNGWTSGACMDFEKGNPANYDPQTLLDHKKAALGPYTRSIGVYRCPSDWSKVETADGRVVPRIRTVSMSQAVGRLYGSGAWLDSRHRGLVYPDDPAGRWKVFTKLDDALDPSRIWVFMDEHPASINDAGLGHRIPDSFAATADRGWVDLPAALHHGSSALSFLDGHAETHRWKEKPRPGRLGMDSRATHWSQLDDGRFPYNRDIWWLAQHTTTSDNGNDPW